MNEIFGEENYRNSIILKRGMKSVQRQFETIDKLGSGYETIFMYSKNSDYRFPRFEIERDDEPIGSWNNHWRGSDRPTMRYDIFGVKPKIGQWRWSESRSKVAIDNYKNMLKDLKKTENNITQEEIDKWYLKQEDESIDLLRLSKNKKPEHYISPSETRLSNDIFFDIPPNSTSTLKNLFEGKVFNNPKPLELIKRLVALSNSENELVLDFFSGSCTTAHAILELNIEKQLNTKFICVQIPEKCDENSDAFKKDLKTISEIGKERIRKVINELKRELKENEGLFKVDKIDLGLRVFKLKDSNFKVWRSDVIEGKEDLGKQLDMFQNPVKPGAEMNNMMWELLVKSGYELTTKVEEREITKCPVQIIAEGELVICLSKLTDTAVKEILKLKPKKVICLDSLFEKNDKLKTNTALQMKDAGVEFKTI
jgi:adenine-specific DNA-methyltransferase